MLIRVEVTKHALERLFERFPKHKRFDAKTVANIFENVIRDGVIVEDGDEIKIITGNYTLCCKLENFVLTIKTVLKTKELRKKYRRMIYRGKRHNWNIIIDVKKLEKMCRRVERMKNVCKICGISREQTKIERCKIYGFYICGNCCLSVGGYSEKCRGCDFDIYKDFKKFRDFPPYIA